MLMKKRCCEGKKGEVRGEGKKKYVFSFLFCFLVCQSGHAVWEVTGGDC